MRGEAARRRTYESEVCIELVNGAERVEDSVRFGDAVTGEERGLALVAAFRVYLHTSRIKMEYSINTLVIREPHIFSFYCFYSSQFVRKNRCEH